MILIKIFFKLMKNAVFGKTMENVAKHRDIKLVAIEAKKIYLVSEPHYKAKPFSENLLAIKMKKTQICMNKPVSSGFSILELSKIVMYELQYDYVKPKYGEKVKRYYKDTGSFIVYIKRDDIYKDIAENVETRFDTSNYELSRRLPKGKNKKATSVMKDELGGKMMKEFLGLRTKTYNYLIDDDSENKKAKKRKLKFENYKNCLEVTQLENKINHPEKNKIDVDSLKED